MALKIYRHMALLLRCLPCGSLGGITESHQGCIDATEAYQTRDAERNLSNHVSVLKEKNESSYNTGTWLYVSDVARVCVFCRSPKAMIRRLQTRKEDV